MREAIRAAIEALEKAEDFAGDVHHGEWAGPSDRRDKVIDKIESALSLLRAAVGEGEKPVAYIWHQHMGEKTKSLRWTKPTQWDYVTSVEPLYASPIAADVQEKKNES